MARSMPPMASIFRRYSLAPSSTCEVSFSIGVRAGQRVNGIRHSALGGDDLLGAQSDERRSLRRQRQGLIAGVGVKRLRPAQYRRQRLKRHAHDVHVGLLRGQRGARGLGVETEHPRARILRLEALAHQARPQAARGAEFRDLLEQIVVRIQEERKARGKVIHRQPARDGRLNVGDGVGQRKRHFLDRRRARLPDVITADGDGIPFRSAIMAEGEDIRHNPQGGAEGIDVRPTRDIFLQDIVLDSPRKLAEVHALLFRHREVERQEDGRGGVNGHRGGDTVQRDVLEKGFHILERINGHAHAAHFATGKRMVRVQTNLGGKIESHRKACLSPLKR